MTYTGQESSEEIVGIYGVRLTGSKYAGILFMTNGFYFRQKSESSLQDMKYADIVLVEKKFSTEIVLSRNGETIEMNGVSYAQQTITSLLKNWHRSVNLKKLTQISRQDPAFKSA